MQYIILFDETKIASRQDTVELVSEVEEIEP